MLNGNKLLNGNLRKGKCPPASRSGNEFQTIATKMPEGVPSTHVRSCVTGYRDNLIIDDGIRYWVKMLGIKSGKNSGSFSQYPLSVISSVSGEILSRPGQNGENNVTNV